MYHMHAQFSCRMFFIGFAKQQWKMLHCVTVQSAKVLPDGIPAIGIGTRTLLKKPCSHLSRCHGEKTNIETFEKTAVVVDVLLTRSNSYKELWIFLSRSQADLPVFYSAQSASFHSHPMQAAQVQFNF